MNAIIALCHFCDQHGPRTLFCTQAFKYTDQNQHQTQQTHHHTQQQQQEQDHQQSRNGDTINNLSELLLMEATSSADELASIEHIVLDSAPSSKHDHHESFSPDSSSNTTAATVNASLPNSRRQSFQINNNNNKQNISRLASNVPPSLQASLYATSLDSVNSTCKACRAFEKNFHHYISYDNNDTTTTTITTNSTQNENNSNEDWKNCSNGNSNICYISQSTPNDSEVFALVRKACLRTLHCEVFEDPIYFDDDKNGSVIGYEFHIKDSEGRGQQRSYSLLIIMKDRIYLQHLWSFLSQQISIIASNIKQEAQAKFDKENKELNPLNGLNQSSFNAQSIRQFTHSNKRHSSPRGLIELTDDPLIFAKLHMWFTWILRMSACQISEEFIHGPLSEDIQVRLEREKLSEQNVFNLDQATRIDSQISELVFETDNENLINCFQVESLRNIIQLVGKDIFHQLAYNLIVGNQVIIQGSNERLVSSIIKCLEDLIPVGCCQSVYYSDKHIKSYECKLLGLSDKVVIVPNGNNLFMDDLNDYVYMNIEFSCKQMNDTYADSLHSSAINFNQMISIIKEKYFMNISIRTNVVIKQEETPSILNRFESYLLNESLDEMSVSSLIKLLKEEWLNKTKVFHKFLKSPSVKDSFDIESVLKMLKLEKNDELALKFWQAGLSDECKTQIRTL